MKFLPPYIYIIAVSFLASFVVFGKNRRLYSWLQVFPFFLLATLFAESAGSYLWFTGKNNLALYNFFTAFEFCFYLFIISKLISSSRVKKIILISIPFYGALAVLNIFFIQKMKTFHTITYSLGCLLVVLFCIYYFFELFKFPKSEKLQTNPAFWICSGLLFFYCCGFPLYGLINSWGNISQLVLDNFDRIVAILNIFLYSLFTIAFLCTRTRKYTLSPS